MENIYLSTLYVEWYYAVEELSVDSGIQCSPKILYTEKKDRTETDGEDGPPNSQAAGYGSHRIPISKIGGYDKW